jgi:hypothetical protein
MKKKGCIFCQGTGYIPGGLAQGQIKCPYCNKPKNLEKWF